MRIKANIIKIFSHTYNYLFDRNYYYLCTEKLFQFLWDNGVYIRKHNGFCKVIYIKSVYIKKECIKLGIIPPQILKKIVLI